MPTTYTHHIYGQEVIKRLPEKLQKDIISYMDYFNLGVYGPDILFYYRCYRKNKVNQYGVQLHKHSARSFFEHAMKVFPKQRDKKAAAAYLYGFMTHYILDSSCHPYIRKQIKKTGISHDEMETDLDALLLLRDGKDLTGFKRACYVKYDRKIAEVIAPFLKKKPQQIQLTLIYMKFTVDHVFRSKHGIKRKIAEILNDYFIPELFGRYFYIKDEINPANEETCRHLLEIYKDSQDLSAEMIVKLYKALKTGDKTFCKEPRLSRVFS
ncbi:MAG: zinc dependent phospholipase C family protein [Eubacterium sp.]|nr:zinc dependent phospholipase C family protein [Eubacterium sp.]MDD7210254.1 zinc dependent phospholipase C family protein [Lachnospiraceae bacterium]MDY5497829.1 zinc dependent phospholipase C family protein [Anaerobutyricum sp.]